MFQVIHEERKVTAILFEIGWRLKKARQLVAAGFSGLRSALWLTGLNPSLTRSGKVCAGAHRPLGRRSSTAGGTRRHRYICFLCGFLSAQYRSAFTYWLGWRRKFSLQLAEQK